VSKSSIIQGSTPCCQLSTKIELLKADALPETPTWQQQLQNLIRDPAELIELLQLPTKQLPRALAASEPFALRVPRSYVRRMAVGDENDPLLRQVLPLGNELLAAPGYSDDPLNELANNALPGLIHKYKGRVLLLVSTSCAINCRYCFRREFPYGENKPSRAHWQRVFAYIAADTSINEVIFSGGDPLTLADSQLAWLTEQVADIPHIKRLRIHTRLPVVLPDRIDDKCLSWLKSHHLQTVMVIHSNHANEIDSDVCAALTRLREAGITLLNQTVLLRGVNDSVAALQQLSETLFAAGVQPYYLHLLDRVNGAAHFEVDEAEARRLHQLLLAELPGFLMPRLVREIAGESSKTPI